MRGLRTVIAGILFWTGVALAQTSGDPVTVNDFEELSLEELLNVKIAVATRTTLTIDETPGIVTMLDRKTIEDSGAKTLGDLVRMIPGFDVSRISLGFGESVDEFFVRGVLNDFSQTTLFLLNGRNKFNDLTFASPWMSTKINVDMIERIEVIRGPGSALYGGNAFASVINIITRDVAGPDGGSILSSFGANNSLNLHGFYKRQLGNWNIGAQAKYFSEDGRYYESLRYDNSYGNHPSISSGHGLELKDYQEVTDGIRPSFDAAFNITAPNQCARFQFWHTFHDLHPFLTGFYPTPNKDRYKYLLKQTFVNGELRPFTGLTIGAHFSYMFWDWATLLLPVYGSLAEEFRQSPEKAYGAEDFIGAIQRNNHAQLDVSYEKSFGAHKLLLGGTYSRENQYGAEASYWGALWDAALPAKIVVSTKPEEGWISYPNHIRKQTAVYAQDEWKVRSNLGLTLGIRYDHFGDIKNGNVINPRLAFVWNPQSGHTLKLLYGSAFRPPSGFEQLGINLGPIIGNKDIEPEKISTAEAAYIFYTKAVRLQISGYLSRVFDSIFTVDDGDPNHPNPFDNVGSVKIKGLELEAQGKHVWLSYSYIDSQMKRDGGAYTGTRFLAAHHLNTGISYNLRPDLILTTQLFLRSERTTPELLKTDAYANWDAKLRYRRGRLEYSLSATNLLDRAYRFPANDGGQYPYPYRPLEWFAAVKYSY